MLIPFGRSRNLWPRFFWLALALTLVGAGCDVPGTGASVSTPATAPVTAQTITPTPVMPSLLATVALGEPATQGHGPCAVAVDEATGRVYVALYESDAVGIIETRAEVAPSGTMITLLPVGSHPRALALNPATGRLFVANYGAASVTFIDVLRGQSPRVVKTVPVGERPVALAAERTAGRLYVACEGSRTLEVLDAESGDVVTTIASARPVGPLTVAVDANAGRVYASYYSTIAVLDTRDWRVLAEWAVGSSSFMVLDPDAGQLYVDRYTTEEGSHLAAVDLETGEVRATLQVGSAPRAAALDPATRFLLVANESSNDVSIVALTPWRVLTSASVGPRPVAIAVDATTGRAYVACQAAHHVAVVDQATRKMEAAIPTAINPSDVAGLNNRAYVVSPSADRVYVVDAEREQVVQTIPVGRRPVAVAANERSQRVYVANAGEQTLAVIEPARLIVGTTISLDLAPADVTIDPLKGRVYAGQAVVDEGTGQVVGRFSLTGLTAGTEVNAEQLVVDPAGGFLYVGAWNGVVGSNSRRIVYRVDALSLRQSPAVGAIGGEYGNLTALDVDVAARRIYLAATQPLQGETTLAVYDADTGDWLASLPLAVRCLALAVNPTTGHLFLVQADSRLLVLNASTLGTVVSLTLPAAGNAVAVDARYNRVYVTHPGPGSLTIVTDVALPPPPAPVNVRRATPSPTPTGTPAPERPPTSGIPLTPGRQPTAVPGRTAVTAPPATCVGTPEGPAGALWEKDATVRRRLGCALTPLQPVIIADQPFEHGRMFWRADIRYIYVVYEYGRWEGHQETYSGGPAGVIETPPAGKFAPTKGFGLVWHTRPGVRQKLGWALAPDRGYETVMQVYQGGLVLRDDQDVTRILFNDGTWIEVGPGD